MRNHGNLFSLRLQDGHEATQSRSTLNRTEDLRILNDLTQLRKLLSN